MKKIIVVVLSVILISILFASTDTDATTPIHAFTVSHPEASSYDGPRSTPTLIDSIDLSLLHSSGYCWGITYDWEIDVLWVSLWNAAYTWVYAIQKTSPCTKVDSFQLGSGAPIYHLGMGFAGGNIIYMAGFDVNIYEINMTTGAGTVFRTLPWSGAEGLGFNVVDDAVYPADWIADQCVWAQPAQSGSWNTWSLTNVSGLSGAYSGALSPDWLFVCDEASPGHFYQYSLVAGVPQLPADSIWDFDPGQTQTLTADCAFDGQYVYILDQSGPDMIWVYDVGITPQTRITWDFETGHQGWTNTNGQPFPAGWDVQSSSYKPAWTPPNADDSSYWIDSDSAGISTWVQDTVLSPACVPLASMDWLCYGIGYNMISSGEWLEVGIKYFDGSTWTTVPLRIYTADTGPMTDSVDVSAYAGYERIQVYFYYDDDDIFAWYAVFDNVTIAVTVYVPQDDVGTTAIIAPGTIEEPNTTLDPTATYRNFGTDTEAFDVFFVIDSSGTNVYSEIANITLGAGTDTTIAFVSWTCAGSNGIIYDVTAYTALSGDTDPSNDTLTQTTTTQSSYWKIYADMPQPTMCHACAYSDVTGAQTVWSLGGNPGYTAIFEFDCATESWTTSSAALNHEAQRTAAAACMGKIYVMGGCDAGFTAHNYAQEFDPVAGTVTDVTPLPTARYFLGAVTWNDTLIYVIGGQYFNIVEIYDPANDAWTTGTAMPITNRSFACGIANDTIYTAGGYNGGYVSDCYMGVIDPANPQSITWTAIADIPTGPSGQPGRSRLQGACVETPAGWRFYFTGGDDHGIGPLPDTWFYDPNLTAWVPMPNKTTPISNSQCAVYVPNPFDGGTFFCAGGYTGSVATAATEGLINIGTGIFEMPPINRGFTSFGFAAMANPSRGMISYTILVSGRVVLKAYDCTGRLVKTLVNAVQPAGVKTVNWDTSNIANGVYFVRLEAENKVATHKMILVK